jgi:hypothetical protein
MLEHFCWHHKTCYIEYQVGCYLIGQGGSIEQLSAAYSDAYWFNIFVFGSGLCSFWIAYLIHYHKELHVHPMSLIKTITAVEAMSYFNLC